MDQELLVPAREDVAGLLVAAVTDLGHRELALEAATDAVVDTLGLAPCLLDTVVTVRLVALLLVVGCGDAFGSALQPRGRGEYCPVVVEEEDARRASSAS